MMGDEISVEKPHLNLSIQTNKKFPQAYLSIIIFLVHSFKKDDKLHHRFDKRSNLKIPDCHLLQLAQE